jgi:hypothetical protein
MKATFTNERPSHHLIELVYQAALHSFWRKDALKRFLRRCNVSENYLAQLSSDERKRDWLDRIIPELEKSTAGGKAILQMAQILAEQTSFPDLESCEDSRDKIQKAQHAVDGLKNFLSKIKLQPKPYVSETARESTNDLLIRSENSLKALKTRLEKLIPKLGTQGGGYEFQDWFYDLVELMEVEGRRPYVISGRQIDGSVTIDGTTFLVELKFTKEQATATDVDSLRAKVHSKADNTMGFMLSMSGYSSTAISEASQARTTVVLLDYSHIYLVLDATITFSELLKRIMRHCSQTGEAFLDIKSMSGN